MGRLRVPINREPDCLALTRQSFNYYTSVGYLSCSQYTSGYQVLDIDLPTTLYRYAAPDHISTLLDFSCRFIVVLD